MGLIDGWQPEVEGRWWLFHVVVRVSCCSCCSAEGVMIIVVGGVATCGRASTELFAAGLSSKYSEKVGPSSHPALYSHIFE